MGTYWHGARCRPAFIHHRTPTLTDLMLEGSAPLSLSASLAQRPASPPRRFTALNILSLRLCPGTAWSSILRKYFDNVSISRLRVVIERLKSSWAALPADLHDFTSVGTYSFTLTDAKLAFNVDKTPTVPNIDPGWPTITKFDLQPLGHCRKLTDLTITAPGCLDLDNTDLLDLACT